MKQHKPNHMLWLLGILLCVAIIVAVVCKPGEPATNDTTSINFTLAEQNGVIADADSGEVVIPSGYTANH